jgi:hypothetical protein
MSKQEALSLITILNGLYRLANETSELFLIDGDKKPVCIRDGELWVPSGEFLIDFPKLYPNSSLKRAKHPVRIKKVNKEE